MPAGFRDVTVPGRQTVPRLRPLGGFRDVTVPGRDYGAAARSEATTLARRRTQPRVRPATLSNRAPARVRRVM
jgi:hypothetical protein